MSAGVAHRFVSSEGGSSCVACGAWYSGSRESTAGRYTGRTGLTHAERTPAHGCDCSLCSPAGSVGPAR